MKDQVSLGILRADSSEYHSSSRCLQHRGHRYLDALPYVFVSVFDHKHGSVVKVTNALMALFANSYYVYLNVFSRQQHRF